MTSLKWVLLKHNPVTAMNTQSSRRLIGGGGGEEVAFNEKFAFKAWWG